ncbi:MAG: hypothetical protein FWC40_03260 [Proteobacteria bacterium]|nr:hypothetical protein [Pseudomonadota bacterium]
MKRHPFALVFTLAAALLCNACEGLFGSTCENDTPMIRVSAQNTLDHDFEIDVFEASRTNASEDSMGLGITTACSYRSVLPWGNVTYQDALNACLDAGKRLCTRAEWQAACGNSTFQSGTCNDSGIESLPAGQKSGCRTSVGAYDMVGNLREWVEEGVLMGGSYNDNTPSCSSALSVGDAFTYRPTASDGFRCCRDVDI